MRGYMAIPLPDASALGEAGLRVAAMGESTARFCACQGSPCNAPTGLNETINLYDRDSAYRVLPGSTGWYPFWLVRAAVEVDRSTFCSGCNDLDWSFCGPRVIPIHAGFGHSRQLRTPIALAADSDSAGSTILGYTHLPPAPSAPPLAPPYPQR